MRAAILVAVMAIVTALLRFLPFLIFRKNTPAYITYLGKVLPSAIIGMLVIYCLRDTDIMSSSHGIPEFAAAAIVALLQAKWRNALLSIVAGTVSYMLLVQVLF